MNPKTLVANVDFAVPSPINGACPYPTFPDQPHSIIQAAERGWKWWKRGGGPAGTLNPETLAKGSLNPGLLR